jgi:2-keto-4-pentenoate hydratase/2-oxohepta-3-ene-1,7-dioic acid hydratase in catechol pathway
MRIIRFIAPDGQIHLGEEHQNDSVTILAGSLADGVVRTSLRASVKKLLAPLEPTDIICIGRNYRSATDVGGNAQSHEADSALEVFVKPSTAIQNPDDPILVPRFDNLNPQMDCEGELAVIIGRAARNVSEFDALQHVCGYTIANDVTARAFQTPTGPPIWMRGKGFDTFLPIGPAIITADEIPNPRALDLRTTVNGKTVRDGNTSQMIRTIPQIIATLSRHLTLRPGTLIITGAPPPMQSAPCRTGDELAVEIPGIGRLQNPLV